MAAMDQIPQTRSIEQALEGLLAISPVANHANVRARLSVLQQKLAAGQLHLAVLGQMKRGKSSLIPVEHLHVHCPLRAESHLSFRVERIFYSLDSFLLLLHGFLMRRIVLRKMRNTIPPLLDVNAGRIRVDYLERLQAGMKHFADDLCAVIAMVTNNLRAMLNAPSAALEERAETAEVLDGIIKDCAHLLL